jgi:ParB family chromosome partitioning protein
MTKLALGRGLEALIPTKEGTTKGPNLVSLPISEIRTPDSQPRKYFSDQGISELAESIREKGVIQPLIVKRGSVGYQLIAGERRLRAALLVGLDHVPAIVMDHVSDMESFQLALIENIQREDLTPLEEAEAFKRLLESGPMTQDELAAKVGKDRSTISNGLRLLSLPPEIREMVNERRISPGHARAILAVTDPQKQLEIARSIAESSLSVRAIEEIIYGGARKKRGRSLKLKRQPSEIFEAETNLKQYLQTGVRVKRSLKGGRIEIDFYNEDDLSRLLDLIMGQHA